VGGGLRAGTERDNTGRSCGTELEFLFRGAHKLVLSACICLLQ